MTIRRARIYDLLALLTVIIVVTIDQWTKALVVANLSPGGREIPFPLVGKYLVVKYIQNRGAAFSFLAGNGTFLSVFIVVAIIVVVYLYLRMLNNGPLAYKLIFGLIMGGAIGNLIDRARNAGYVVDFISFRIPEINYYFAVFNVADACISVGVFLLFLLALFGGLGRKAAPSSEQSAEPEKAGQGQQQEKIS
ncbi:MAG: signal peptidase II [Ktedonobacteraceae bacterium]|nr:signal peptidase II [Ktedonobacteraceae bacterium]